MKTFNEEAKSALEKIGYEDDIPKFAALLVTALERLEFYENSLKYIGREDIVRD